MITQSVPLITYPIKEPLPSYSSPKLNSTPIPQTLDYSINGIEPWVVVDFRSTSVTAQVRKARQWSVVLSTVRGMWCDRATSLHGPPYNLGIISGFYEKFTASLLDRISTTSFGCA